MTCLPPSLPYNFETTLSAPCRARTITPLEHPHTISVDVAQQVCRAVLCGAVYSFAAPVSLVVLSAVGQPGEQSEKTGSHQPARRATVAALALLQVRKQCMRRAFP
eukprot:TRINITY_DN32676_c0_g1_i1.p1 TRINITY_DN32676_c0_g1~~TRINITY_DN32676_c0_g1_i1.p1  ORF type:complete len:114 (+),score=7.46 TRINITY_DN32676_c0_g1_i1:26-343(+)